MAAPNKIQYRDLSPELQAIINGEAVEASKAIEAILAEYRKTTDVISEQDIEEAYRNSIANKIKQLQDNLQALVNSLQVISEERLAVEFVQRVTALEAKIPILYQERQNTAAELQDLSSALKALRSEIQTLDTVRIEKRIDAVDKNVDKVAQDVLDLQTADTRFDRLISNINTALDNKRSKDERITKNDLNNELVNAVENGALAYNSLQELSDKMNKFPDVAKGEYLGTIDENGTIRGKNIFFFVKTVEEEADMGTIEVDPEYPAVALSNGHCYVAKAIKDDSGETEIEDTPTDDENKQVVEYQYVYMYGYFEQEPSLWNIFLVDVDSNQICGAILKDGVFIKLNLGGGGKNDSNVLDTPLAKGTRRVIKRDNALTRQPITVFAKDNDITSQSYGSYIPAEHIVEVSYNENSYTLYNTSDEDLDLWIKG